MKNLIIVTLSIILLIGCDERKLSQTNFDNQAIENTNVYITTPLAQEENTIFHFDNVLKNSLEQNDNSNNNFAEDILKELENSSDLRELVYLMTPEKNIIVYCYHSTRSECYLEGKKGQDIFKYNISQVEGQNIGKITLDNTIEVANTKPTEWLIVEDDKVIVLMTSKIKINSQWFTSEEPLLINFKSGIHTR